MNEAEHVTETARQLANLVSEGKLTDKERDVAMRCHRRLLQPLRLAIFGTDPKHALQLLNLLAGQALVPPFLGQVYVHAIYSKSPYAEFQLRNGESKRIEGIEFRKIFAEKPIKTKLGVDLPLLQKVAFMVTANPDPAELCIGAERALSSCDMVLWAGGKLTDRMAHTWANMPERLRDHSHLVLPQSDEIEKSWACISDEFVSAHQVDARAAQTAKMKRGGIDKVGFQDSGGADVVKAIKKEIANLRTTAFDGAKFILMRRAEADDQPAVEQDPQSEAGFRPKLNRRPRKISIPLDVRFENNVKKLKRPQASVVPITHQKRRIDDDDTDESRATPWSLGL